MPERSDGSRRLSGVNIFHNLATGPKHMHIHTFSTTWPPAQSTRTCTCRAIHRKWLT
jgi:hypothetical protein